MALTVLELKQANKQLKTNEKEKAKAKQAAYDVKMTKVAKSLTAQLRDVACAFCLEVWSQTLKAAGVDTESKLRAPDSVLFPCSVFGSCPPPPLSLLQILALPPFLPHLKPVTLPLPLRPRVSGRKKNFHLQWVCRM